MIGHGQPQNVTQKRILGRSDQNFQRRMQDGTEKEETVCPTHA